MSNSETFSSVFILPLFFRWPNLPTKSVLIEKFTYSLITHHAGKTTVSEIKWEMVNSLQLIECFHVTLWRPYWCPKTIKRRPCWCPKPVLWELNSFLMQTLSFVLINLHRCSSREWKHSIAELSRAKRASGAPWVRKWSNLPIRENLVITWPYTDRPPERPSVRTTGKPM